MANRMPDKPKTQKEKIDMLWDACFNHLPSRLDTLGIRVNFILGFLALILALLGILIVR